MIKIAISGKGGVGKTTIAGTLARFLARNGYDVLAIDADPSMNLASALGIRNPPRPLTEFKELIEERAGGPGGVFKLNPKVDDIVAKFGVTGPDNVKLLVLGTIERGGSGCMCPASSFLKALLRHVILKTNSVVVLDMEAGIEHLGRGTTKGIDMMIIVVEPGARSIETAGRIIELGRQIGIKKFGAVINKTPYLTPYLNTGNKGTHKAGAEVAEIEGKLDEYGIAVIGVIPYDAALIRADMAGTAPIDGGGAAILAIKDMCEKVLMKKE